MEGVDDTKEQELPSRRSLGQARELKLRDTALNLSRLVEDNPRELKPVIQSPPAQQEKKMNNEVRPASSPSSDSKHNILKELEDPEHSSVRDPSEIDIEMQDEIDEVPVDKDLSIRYESLIESMKDGNISPEEVQQVCKDGFFVNPFEHIQVLIRSNGRVSPRLKSIVKSDRQLWSIFMFAVYYNRTAVVDHLLSGEYGAMFNPLAIQAPPISNQEFHIMIDDQDELNASKTS